MPPVVRSSSSTFWLPSDMEYRQRRYSDLPPLSYTTDDLPSLDDTTTGTSSRNYVDPWDLENYAFIRRNCSDIDTDYMTSTPALESSQSDFYYVPNVNNCLLYRPNSVLLSDDSMGHVAGIEEEDFHNDRYEMNESPHSNSTDCYVSCRNLGTPSPFRASSCYFSKTDGDSYDSYDTQGGGSVSDEYVKSDLYYQSSNPTDPRRDCQLYSPSIMLRRPSDSSLMYVYEMGSRKRKMALPKTNFDMENMRKSRADSSAGDYYSGNTSDDTNVTEDSGTMVPPYDDLGYYCDIYNLRPMPPQHFGLSKYGHLKIDYSFSWNSLHRYITAE